MPAPRAGAQPSITLPVPQKPPTPISPNPFLGGAQACQVPARAVNPAPLADQLMSEPGAGGQPIKSCQMREQVGARWTARTQRGQDGQQGDIRVPAVCVALVFLLCKAAGAHSQSTSRFVLEGPHGERLGWRGNAGKVIKNSPGPRAQPSTQSHHRGQKSRWVEAAGMRRWQRRQ